MTLALIICIIGAIVYLLAEFVPTNVAELGRLAFWVGLLAYLLK